MAQITASIVVGNKTIAAKDDGTIINFNGTNWTNSDGTVLEGTPEQPFNDGTISLNRKIYDIIEFNNEIYFCGEFGLLFKWNSTSELFTDLKINISENFTKMIAYDNTIVLGTNKVNIYSYDGQNWKYPNSLGAGSGIYLEGYKLLNYENEDEPAFVNDYVFDFLISNDEDLYVFTKNERVFYYIKNETSFNRTSGWYLYKDMIFTVPTSLQKTKGTIYL